VRYDSRSEQYVIDPTVPMSSSAKDVIYLLCELGWLYSKVHAYTNKVENSDSCGQVAQALGYALQVNGVPHEAKPPQNLMLTAFE